MHSMLSFIRGTIDASRSLRSTATLQRAIGAQLLVVCADLGPPFTFDEAEEAREQAQHAFRSVCGTDPRARFKVAAGELPEMMRKQSMFADLCVLSRGFGVGGDDLATLKTSLVDAGTATILLPPEPVPAAPATIVLSWNGQPASARAIKAAAPFARQAGRVLVLEHAGNEVNRSRLEQFLRSNDVAATWRAYGEKGLTARGRARALLAAARAEGAELLVMGAYGDAGERLFRFGRATEKVASAARLPVLFSC